MRKEKPPVMVQDIVDCIEEWEESLRWIAGPDPDEYDYDVSKREYLDDALREYGDQPLPKELTERIAQADQRFRELTKESDHRVFSNFRKYDDRERYWYYYRSSL